MAVTPRDYLKVISTVGVLNNSTINKYTSLRRGHLVTGNIKVMPCPTLNLTEYGSQKSNLQN
jgi:hypothetical protein